MKGEQVRPEWLEELERERAKWEAEVLHPLLQKHGVRREEFVRSGGERVGAVYASGCGW